MRVPENEPQRVAVLRSYDILDSPAEYDYDELTALAARILQTPISYIKFFDEKRAWFKSHVGFPPDLKEVPREATICNLTLCEPDLVVVPDCMLDERFRELPTVTGWPNIRFYCGMPLINPEGYALGTFCVLDTAPREIAFEMQETLRTLARQVVHRLELRRSTSRLHAMAGEMKEAQQRVAAEQARADALLGEILPQGLTEEYKARGQVAPRYHPLVSVLFSDFDGFTRRATSMEPAALVNTLDCYFAAFDDAVERHGLEKIKTIGDSYMAAGGVPVASRSHVVDACLAALDLQDCTARLNRERDTFGQEPWQMRIGLHAGPVMSGVVGRRKFTYDIWGDVVNVAQRMEEAGVPGRINISEAVYQRVRHLFECEARGMLDVRGKGELAMYFLNRIKPELAADESGRQPNQQFALERQRL